MSSFQALSSKKNAAMPFAHQGSDPTLSKSAKMMAKAAHSDGGGPSMARQGGGGGGGGGGGSFKRPSSTLPEVKRPANATAKRPSTVDPGAATKVWDVGGDHPPPAMDEREWADSLHKTSESFAGSAKLPVGDSFVPISIMTGLLEQGKPRLKTVEKNKSWIDQVAGETGIPFSRLNSRQYANKRLTTLVNRSESIKAAETGFDPSEQHAAPGAGRSEAVLLQQAFDEMLSNVKNDLGGLDAMQLARQAASEAEAETMMSLLEPQYYAMDTCMRELVKQVEVGCKERGALIERCRAMFVECFSTSALCLHKLGEKTSDAVERAQREAKMMKGHMSAGEESERAVEKMAAMELELNALQNDVKVLQEELDKARRQHKSNSDGTRISNQREIKLMEQVEESESINGHLKSRINIVESQLVKAETNNGMLQSQVLELSERIRRDAEHLEIMSESIARYKVRCAWLRAIAFVRRQKKDVADAETQEGGGSSSMVFEQGEGEDGEDGGAVEQWGVSEASGGLGVGAAATGVGAGVVGGRGRGGASSGAAAKAGGGLGAKGGFVEKGAAGALVQGGGQGGVGVDANGKKKQGGGVKADLTKDGNTAIPYTTFWTGIVKSADMMDVEDNVRLQMSKKQMLEYIGKIYTEKILVDEVDDRFHMPRQSLSEFLYDYNLELLGEPMLAEEALINLVANARLYEGTSARTRMFSRFLSMSPTEKPLPVEALSVFLLALVRIKNGEIPLLPDYDSISVSAEKAIKTIEYVFAQAPYVVRSKIVLEAEKRCANRVIDLDSLLFFIVDQYVHEASRGEERLRALFVASDSDGDGNLTLQEFSDMVKHVNSKKSHREFLRMYSEMTLNRAVDCNTFVRVCRKFSFFHFTYGPHSKKVDRSAAEVFELLQVEWSKVHDMVHELLVVLEGTAVGMRLEQNVQTLKALLEAQVEAEAAWHCYRKVIAEFTSVVKNRTPKSGGASVSSADSTPRSRVGDEKEGSSRGLRGGKDDKEGSSRGGRGGKEGSGRAIKGSSAGVGAGAGEGGKQGGGVGKPPVHNAGKRDEGKGGGK